MSQLTPITIRKALPRDADAIVAIRNQTVPHRLIAEETWVRSALEVRDQIRNLAADMAMIVAERDGAVVGWAGFGENHPVECHRGVGDYAVHVDQAHRGIGIGRRLLQSLLDSARAKGCWKVVGKIITSTTPAAVVERLIPENIV